MGLVMKERKAVTRETRLRYRKATKKAKKRILDEFTRLAGYNRKYAITLLNREDSARRGGPTGKERRGRPRMYAETIVEILVWLWKLFDFMCGKRLVVAIRTNLEILAHRGDVALDARQKEKLLSISSASIDRLLKAERKRTRLKGRSYTTPGSLLKHQIPIRTFSDWEENRPGFVEADLVGHDGGSSRGDFAHTLTVTDVCTGWTEIRAVKNKARKWVFAALKGIRGVLPFPLQGIDSDNGGEFINAHLVKYCDENSITFTRSRPQRKNDNCYVEQKNGSVVRAIAGYCRYDTDRQVRLLNSIYGEARLLVNFFYPSMKLIEKTRIGSKVKKRYDVPKTPYQRVLDSVLVSAQGKEELMRQQEGLNLVEIKRRMEVKQDQLVKLTASIHKRSQREGQKSRRVAK